MTPKEYLEIALGVNYNISTITLSALEDILKSYADIKIKESKQPETMEMLKRCEFWISACNEDANILNDIKKLTN